MVEGGPIGLYQIVFEEGRESYDGVNDGGQLRKHRGAGERLGIRDEQVRGVVRNDACVCVWQPQHLRSGWKCVDHIL